MKHKLARACISAALVVATLVTGLDLGHPSPSLAQAPQPVVFSGSVMIGRFSDAAIALYQVTVELYCSDDADSLGRPVASAQTDTEGSYTFDTAEDCKCYNVVSGEASGSTSFLADSLRGKVIRSNWIQHLRPLEDRDVWGDYFWYAPSEDLSRGATPALSPEAPAGPASVATARPAPDSPPTAAPVSASPTAARPAFSVGSRPTIPGGAVAIIVGVVVGALWAYRTARSQRGQG